MKLTEAIIKACQYEKRLAKGLRPEYLSMTLGQAFDTIYLPAIHSESSRKTHLSRFNSHIRPPLGDRPLDEITFGELVKLIDHVSPSRQCRRAIGKLKASTRNRIVAELRAMFSKFTQLELIESNVAQGLRMIPERNQRTRILRDDEEIRFFAALDEAPLKMRLLVTLLVLTGMRLGEALSARWDFVDIGNRIIRLPDTKGGRPRVIPLSLEACSICQQLQDVRRNAYLFPGRDAGPMSRPSRQIKALFTAAGVEGLWIHDLRRSFATRIAEILPTHAVSAILGHSSTAVTERYLVATDLRLHDAADSIGRQLAPLISGKTL